MVNSLVLEFCKVMYLVIISREVVCNSLLKLNIKKLKKKYMVSGMFFFERVEIEILE